MIKKVSLQEWIDFDAAHPAPTYFARPAWTQALCDANQRVEPWPMRVLSDGAAYIVPAVRSASRLPIRHLVAFPLGGYTCVMDENGQLCDAAVTTRVAQAVSAACDRCELIFWPLGPQPAISSAQMHGYETAVIDCGDGFEAAMRNVRGVTRRMAGQAARRGVVCARSGGTPEDVEAYYGILEEASCGWGLAQPPYPRKLLQAVMARGGADAEIWFATVDGEHIGGGVVLYGSQELFFWSAAMRRSHSQYRPSNALNLALIENACRRGLRWYNLGASEGLAGVERFKTDLGASTVEYAQFSTKRPHVAMLERMRGALLPEMEAR